MGIETMVALSLASTAVGGVTSAIGAQQQGKAQAAAANYQAQVADNNAQLAKRQAVLQEQKGLEDAAQQGRLTAARVGSQRAALAAAGVDVNSGTALDDQVSTQMTGRLDALHIYDSAVSQAFATDQQATNFSNEATLKRASGKNAETAGNIATASSLVSSAGSFSDKWLGFQRTGAAPSFSFGDS